VLAVAGYVINLTISRGEQEATKQRDKTEHEIAQDKQRETALQEYIDKMLELLLHENLRSSKSEDEVRNLARVRTLTILRRCNPERKGNVLKFIYESKLILNDDTIVDLNGADLNNADLYAADLGNANLSGAKLDGADLMVNKAKSGQVLRRRVINQREE
jgi:pentapeptide repeat protein